MGNYKLKIKEIRVRKGMTQKELAKKAGVSRSYFGDLENGKYDIKLSLFVKISNILEVDLFDLIEINT